MFPHQQGLDDDVVSVRSYRVCIECIADIINSVHLGWHADVFLLEKHLLPQGL